MKKKKEIAATKNKPASSIKGLENETHEKNAVQKGYNEKNPGQPQGAFKPDAMDNRKKKS